MMKIVVPPKLDFENSLWFSQFLEGLKEDTEYIFDFSRMGIVEPFGMLLISAKLRQVRKKLMFAKCYARNFESHSYAAHMGFFQSFNLDFGKKPGEATGNNHYIPIKSMNVADIELQSITQAIETGDVVEQEAEALTEVLTAGHADSKIESTIIYSLREIMRNVVEHSQADKIWIAGQFWPTKNLAQIAILDEGIGVRAALGDNPYIRINSDADALRICIQPGISGKAYKGQKQRKGFWENSGFGLYVTSEICKRGGNFGISSGCNGLFISHAEHKAINAYFSGTAVMLNIDTSRLACIDIPSIVNSGRGIAQAGFDFAITTASGASKTARIVRKNE